MKRINFADLDEAGKRAFIDEKRRRRMDMVDQLEPQLRTLVHDYGFTVVHAFLEIGVRNPRHIRHLVENVLNEFSPTRGSYSAQGLRKDVDTGIARRSLT